MQGGRGPFSGFGDPFAGFGGFGSGFEHHRNLMSSLFGGRDPFDDPFFTQPFGSVLFNPRFFGPPGNPFMNGDPSGFLEHQPSQAPRSTRGPIIEELDAVDNKEGESENRQNPRKHGRSSKEPYVEVPDDETEESGKPVQFQSHFNRHREMAPQRQGHSFSFQSSTVSYGGVNGKFYTSSKMRRTGSDGLTFEESKEANSATGEAKHDVLRGIHNRGHSVSRKLNSDGRVDTMQTLHNLNEDELAGFEESWEGNARKRLPGLSGGHGVMGSRNSTTQTGPSRTAGWALPSAESSHRAGGAKTNMRGAAAGPSRSKPSGNMQMNDGDGAGLSRARSRARSGTGKEDMRRPMMN